MVKLPSPFKYYLNLNLLSSLIYTLSLAEESSDVVLFL